MESESRRAALRTLLSGFLICCAGAVVAADEPEPPQFAPLLQNLFRLFNAPDGRDADAEATANSRSRDAVDARVPKDAQIESLWQIGRDAAAREDWKQAVDLLQRLLDLPEDVAVETRLGEWGSVRSAANRLLGSLPRTVLTEYERRFGGLARQLLAEHRARPDVARLVDCATRYFHTEAGAEAAALLATWHFDQREFIPATLWNQELLLRGWKGTSDPRWRLQAAYAARAAGVEDLQPFVEGLIDETNRGTVILGGRSVTPQDWWRETIPRSSGLPVALEWREFGGTSARWTSGTPGAPLLLHEWSQPLSSVPTVRRKLGGLLKDLSDDAAPAIPASSPIVLSDKVAFRDLRSVRVVDIATGRTLWHTEEGVSPERILNGVPAEMVDQTQVWRMRLNAEQLDDEYQGGAADMHPLASWLFRDATNGFLSSDGERLYVLEDVAVMTRNQSGYSGDADADAADPFGATWASNRLSAYEVSSGRLVWTIGGPATQEVVKLPLSGSFFFGVPTIDREELYVVASSGQEIRLHALDPATGKPRWSQLLAYSDTKIELDIARRWLSAPVAVRDGVILCPTTVGWIVAVDRARRCLLWAHRYWPRSGEEELDPASQFLLQRSLHDCWAAGAPTISGRDVLFAPPDADILVCLNALDGRKRWERPRGDGLYFTAVAPHRALIISASEAVAVDTSNGKPVWQAAWNDDLRPTGRGCICGDEYAIPLSSGAVWMLSLESGEVRQRLQLPANAPPLGNLVKVGSRFISLGPEGCRAFIEKSRFLEVLAKFPEADAPDAAAQLRSAEYELLQGDYESALRRLTSSAIPDWPLELRARRRQAIWSALMSLVAADPDQSESYLKRLSEVASGPAEEFQVEVARIDHWLATGNLKDAFERCRELAADATPAEEVIRPDALDVSVSRSAWIAGQMQDIWDSADETLRREIETSVGGLLEVALTEPIDDQLSLAKWVDFHPDACRLHWSMAEKWARASMFSRAEAELLPWIDHPDPAIALETQLRLAVVWQRFELTADAAYQVRQVLDASFSGTLRNGLTVAETLREWELPSTDSTPASPQPAPGSRRPLETARLPAAYLAQVQELAAPLDQPLFARLSIQWEPQDQRLSFQDRLTGEWTWLAPLRGSSTGPDSGYAPYQFLGKRLIILQDDVLQSVTPVRKETAWSVAVAEDAGVGIQAHRPLPQPLFDTSTLENDSVFWTFRSAHQGRLAVCNHRAIAVTSRRTLSVYDPQTGRLRWTHRNLPVNATVFGTSETLFVVDGAENSALAFRSLDGRPVVIPNLRPQLDRVLTVIGNDVIQVERLPGLKLFNLAAGPVRLRRHNLQTGTDRWQTEFRAGSQIGLIDSRHLMAVGTAGRTSKPGRTVEVLDLNTGTSRKLDNLPRLNNEESLTPLLDRERLYLIANHGDFGSYNYGDSLPSTRVHGTLFAWDRGTGQLAWSRKVEDQNLVLDRFQDAPLLVFLARNWKQVGEATYTKLHLLALDKQTGEPLHDSQTPALFNGFHGLRVAEPEHQVELLSYNLRLRLIPTAETPAAAAPAPATP